MTDTATPATDLTGTMASEPDAQKIATVTLSGDTLTSWLTPVLPFAAGPRDMPPLRGIELHVADGWVLASATDRYRAACHRLPITAGNLVSGEAQVTAPFTTGMYVSDVRHLLAVIAGCDTVEVDVHDEDYATVEHEHGLATCNANVRVNLDIWPDRIDDLEENNPLRLWSTSNYDSGRAAIGWSIGRHLVGVLMPVASKTDIETADPNPLADKAWKGLAETAGGAA